MQQCNGPFGGIVTTVFYNNQGVLFAGTSTGGGMYKSTNNGLSWIRAIEGIYEVNSIVQGTNGRLFAAVDSNIFVSTNNGSNWNSFQSFYSFLKSVCCTPNGVLLAGGWYGDIYCSTNNGLSWTITSLSGLHSKIISNSTYIFLNASNTLYRSSNNGNNWQSIYANLPAYISDLTFDTQGNLLFAFQYAILKSTNNGINWVNICNIQNISAICSSVGGDLFAGSTGGKIYKSSNGGGVWTEVYSNPAGFGIYSLYARPDGYVFAGILNLGLIISSNNGSSWNRYSEGITNQRIIKTETDNAGYIYAGTSGDGLYKTTDKGNNWSRIAFENKNTGQLKKMPNGDIYIKVNETGNGIYKSTNSGINWIPCLSYKNNMNINTLCVSTTGSMFIGTSDSGLYKSTNNGNNWNKCSFDGKGVISVFVDNEQRIFVSVVSLNEYGVYRSTNDGIDWTQLNPNIFDGIVNEFVKSPSGILFAGNIDNFGVNRVLYKSTDNGNSWVPVFNFSVKCIAVNSLNHVFVSNGSEIYFSIDDGENWIQINISTDFNVISDLNFDTFGFLYVSTLGSSVFRSIESTIGIEKISEHIPSEFSLNQNYPNPFNPTTIIEFDIKSNSVAKITIYDINGCEIAVLVNAKFEPGKYRSMWTANNLASGVYFCRMECGNFIETKKMLLFK